MSLVAWRYERLVLATVGHIPTFPCFLAVLWHFLSFFLLSRFFILPLVRVFQFCMRCPIFCCFLADVGHFRSCVLPIFSNILCRISLQTACSVFFLWTHSPSLPCSPGNRLCMKTWPGARFQGWRRVVITVGGPRLSTLLLPSLRGHGPHIYWPSCHSFCGLKVAWGLTVTLWQLVLDFGVELFVCTIKKGFTNQLISL